MSKQKRFVPLKIHRGIAKDMVTKKYLARKKVNGKEYYKTFKRLSDAMAWRRNFHPLLTNVEIKGTSVNNTSSHELATVQTRLNGIDQRFTLRNVWELYQKLHFPALEKQTKDTYTKYAKNFFSELMGLKMQTIMPEVLDAFMERRIEEAKIIGNTRRNNFNNDLKCLKTLLNWYRENYDGMFVVPVLKRHFIFGIIQRVSKRSTEKMSLENVRLFLDAFESSFWRDFAELHFFMAGRVQEAGGLQWRSVDFQRKLITVRDVSIWGEKKKFTYLKEIPKNGEQRIVCLNEQMLDILRRRRQDRSNIPCEFLRQSTGERLDFVFEIKGQPVSYRSAQHQYNMALKKAGLYPKFRSTHILRKAMANIVRQGLGLEAAQAAGGWKSRSIVERIYTDAPSDWSQRAVDYVGNWLKKGEDKDKTPHGA